MKILTFEGDNFVTQMMKKSLSTHVMWLSPTINKLHLPRGLVLCLTGGCNGWEALLLCWLHRCLDYIGITFFLPVWGVANVVGTLGAISLTTLKPKFELSGFCSAIVTVPWKIYCWCW